MELVVKRKNYLFLFVSVVLSIFAGIRGENVGADYNNYKARFLYFYNIEYTDKLNLLFDGGFEPGYLLINYIFSWSNNGYIGVFLTFSFLTVSINYYFIQKYSPYIGISFLLYFSHLFLNTEMIQIRGGLATSVLLFSLKYLVSRDILKYLLVVFIAGSVHYFALIAIPLYFIFRKGFVFSKSTPIYVLLPCLLSLFVSFPSVLGFLIGDYVPAYTQYSSWERYSYELGLLNPVFLKQMGVLSLFYFFRTKLKLLNNDFIEGAIFLYCIATVWLFVFRDFAIFSARGASFISIADFIIVPYLILLFRQKFLIWFGLVLLSFGMLVANVFFKVMIRDYYTFISDIL
jgi:hypothetical protein